MVLFFIPANVAVTLTEKEHWEFWASVAPFRDIEPLPAVAVIIPPQFPDRLFGVDTTKPAGNVSVKPIPVSPVETLLFWMVKVRLVDSFGTIVVAPNAVEIAGGAITLMFVETVTPSIVAVAVSVPAEVALNVAPAVPLD